MTIATDADLAALSEWSEVGSFVFLDRRGRLIVWRAEGFIAGL